jgi:hypothetical protein
MPFKKKGHLYISPRGKKYTKKQMMAYYAKKKKK